VFWAKVTNRPAKVTNERLKVTNAALKVTNRSILDQNDFTTAAGTQ
jgi:hypothetical protein